MKLMDDQTLLVNGPDAERSVSGKGGVEVMDMAQVAESDAQEMPKVHQLSEVADIPETLAARLREAWIATVEEAVAWLAAQDGEDKERDEFMAKAKLLLGAGRFAELGTPAPEKSMGCELSAETKEEGELK